MRINKTSGLNVGFCREERAVQLLNKIEGYGLQEKSYYYIKNRGVGMGGGAQCVELALRWQFRVHSSICHEMYI